MQLQKGFQPIVYVRLSSSSKGSSIKDVGIFLAVFETPLHHVGILTLIYLTSTF